MRYSTWTRWVLCGLLAALPFTMQGQATEKTLYDFTGPDGAAPWGGLVQASDGNFYGATFEGGDNGTGTLYRVSGGTVTTLYSFPASGNLTFPAASLIEGQDGNLYGVTCGNDQPTNSASVYGSLYKVTSFASGAPSVSTVFNFTGTSGANQGTCPLGGLIQDVNGVLYGTTFGGGPDDYGTVFSYTASSNTFVTLYSFTGGTDGGNPYSGLVQGSNGNFFGVTSAGGSATPCPSKGTPAIGCGVIFRVSSRNGAFLVLHTFQGTDGAFPTTQLTEGSDNYLYGTACGGGGNGDGVLFKLLPDGKKSTYDKLVDLTAPNGQNCTQGGPEIGPLFLAGDGNFYGADFGGGANSDGEVFSYTPGASTVSTFYSFTSTTGQQPYTTPMEGADGNFYGPTIAGGTAGEGTVYELTPDSAVPPAITLTSNNSNPGVSESFELQWNVANANSKTLSLCYASSSSGTFTGKKGTSGKTNIKETATGVHTYALTCGGVESAIVSVTVGSGTGPTITLTSAGHNFVSVPEGTSERYGIQLTNGTTMAFPFSLSLTGSSTFTEQDNCGTSVAAGAKCEIVFTYTAPSDSEWDSAAFTIAANGFAFSPSNSGTLAAHSVTPGVITLNSDEHDFGAVEFGDLPQFSLIISNGASQAVPLSFTPSGDTTDFTYSNDCPASLPVSGQCQVVFTYSPSSTSFQTFYYAISTGSSGVPIQPGSTLELLGYGTNN